MRVVRTVIRSESHSCGLKIYPQEWFSERMIVRTTRISSTVKTPNSLGWGQPSFRGRSLSDYYRNPLPSNERDDTANTNAGPGGLAGLVERLS